MAQQASRKVVRKRSLKLIQRRGLNVEWMDVADIWGERSSQLILIGAPLRQEETAGSIASRTSRQWEHLGWWNTLAAIRPEVILCWEMTKLKIGLDGTMCWINRTKDEVKNLAGNPLTKKKNHYFTNIKLCHLDWRWSCL